LLSRCLADTCSINVLRYLPDLAPAKYRPNIVGEFPKCLQKLPATNISTIRWTSLRVRINFGRGNAGHNPQNLIPRKGFCDMWKPTNPPTPNARQTPPEPERSAPSVSTQPAASETIAPPRPVVSSSSSTADQATIGKSLVIKGEVTGSEALYIDGRVEGSINLSGNRVTVGRNGVVSANINAREIVVLGKVRGNLTASDRVDIRSDGSLT